MCVFLSLCTYIYVLIICVQQQFLKQEIMNLQKSEEAYMAGFGEEVEAQNLLCY